MSAPVVVPPDSELGWADDDGGVKWADMDNHLAWLADKAREASTPAAAAEFERKAETLRGWCKLFDHKIADAPKVRDGCEWNPAMGADEHHATTPATLMIGAQVAWRLCSSCAALPKFKRFRVRRPIVPRASS